MPAPTPSNLKPLFLGCAAVFLTVMLFGLVMQLFESGWGLISGSSSYEIFLVCIVGFLAVVFVGVVMQAIKVCGNHLLGGS